MSTRKARIVVDPKIQHGKPVIRGTRVPVARIVGGLAGGMTFQEVQEEGRQQFLEQAVVIHESPPDACGQAPIRTRRHGTGKDSH
jgi:hypothetical protein